MCDEPQIGDECLFYDNHNDYVKCKDTLVATTSDGRFIDNENLIWKYCERIKKKITVVKKASEIIKWCEEHGYKWGEHGYIDPQDKYHVWPSILADCGRELIDGGNYHEDWLEEKEV